MNPKLEQIQPKQINIDALAPLFCALQNYQLEEKRSVEGKTLAESKIKQQIGFCEVCGWK
jgi:hypothetical protein